MYPNPNRIDRYISLRELLRRPLKGTTELISLAREIGYAILNIADDQQNVMAALARIEKNLLDYIEDSLHFRKKRIEREGGGDSDLIDTQDLLDKLKERKLMVTTSAPAKITETTVQLKPAEAEKKPSWLTEKLINLVFMILGGILLTIVQAILKLAFGGK